MVRRVNFENERKLVFKSATRFTLGFIGLSLLVLIVASPLFAQSLDPIKVEEAEQAISAEIMSPFCPGRLLSDCPSTSAAELRASIRKMLEEGKSRTDVLAHLYTLYGDQLSAAPAKEGFGLVAWTTPFIFLLLGGVIVAIWLVSKNRKGIVEPQTKTLDPELEARVNAELRK